LTAANEDFYATSVVLFILIAALTATDLTIEF